MTLTGSFQHFRWYAIRLSPGKNLVVFDEVQKYPKARELIKYLVKDGRFDYIETGSPITLKQEILLMNQIR